MNHPTNRPGIIFELRFCLGMAMGVLLLVSCAPKPEARQEQRGEPPPAILVPMEWTPSLEQVQADVEESIAAQPHQSQQALNRASQHMADLADARLFITCVLLAQKLDERPRAELFTEQKMWLAQRAESAQAAVVSKGGSLEPLEYTSAFREITQKRLTELESRLRLRNQTTPAGDTPGREGQ